MAGFSPLSAEDPRSVAGYVLHARIGSGGMGAVYLSFTPGGRPIAIKVIQPVLAGAEEFRSRFRQEVAAAQRVQGLYTAPVIDADPDGPVPWLATAYVPGPSLQQAVQDQGALPLGTVFRLMAGVAEALGTIHAAGLVHRDLKPSNVLLAQDGPRVIDFGIARAADATSLTRTGVRVGTPSFMTPEQVRGTPVTPATDVFALGQLCVFAATGHPAFGEGPTEAIFYRIAYEQPSLDDCPPALRDIAGRCLAKDPQERPPVAELISAARAETAGETMRLAGEWLPPAIAATLVAYDAKVARGAAQAADTEVERRPAATPPAPQVYRQPALVQSTGDIRSPAGGISMPVVVALTAVVAAAVLLAAVLGAHLLVPSGTSTPVSDTTSPIRHTTAESPASGAGPPSPDRTQPPATAPGGYTIDTEQGYAIEVPSDWSRRLKPVDGSGSVFWYAPDGASYLQVDPEPWSPGTARTQAQLADNRATRNPARFPGYQLGGITDVVYQQDAADWDFVFQDPSGAGPIHGRDRFFQAGGRPFAIYLRALVAHWPGYQEALTHFYSSFRLI